MIRNSTEAAWRPLSRQPGRFIRDAAYTTLLLWTGAFAQDVTEAQRCEDFEQYRNIRTAEPARPDRGLREANITDEEVSEIQRAAHEVYPDSIVNISGVTDGCDCEDGDSCTAQVWLALYRESHTRSLVLSKIGGHWRIGAVQSWWLQYDAHQAGSHGFGSREKELAWHQENQRLLDAFPTCPAPVATWALVRSDAHSSACFDMSSMEVSGSIRRVNIKVVSPSREQMLPFNRIKYSIDLVAFDCKDHRQQISRMDNYYYDGRVTKTSRTDPVLWSPIRSGTIAAADLDLVCGWAGK
jgi:hypothetical protein